MVNKLHRRENAILGKLDPIEPRVFCYICGKPIDHKMARQIKINGACLFYTCRRKQCEEIAKKTLRRRGIEEVI